MMDFISLFKIFCLTSTIELGYIPGHDVSLFIIPDYQTMLSINQTFYADYQAKLTVTKYGFITGGMTAFSLIKKSQVKFYPIRMDFALGAGIQFKAIELGWMHECYHPIAPNSNSIPLPKIDSAKDRFYIRACLGKSIE